MNRNLFSAYGRAAKPLEPGIGKTFILVPSGSALIPELQDNYPQDEDGVTRVYTDPATALAAVVSGRGDTILVFPGTYTITSVLSSSASDWRLVGVGKPGEAMFVGSASNILTLTGDGVEITSLGFTIASTKVAITLTSSDYNKIHNNLFLSNVGGTGSSFITMSAASNHNRIEGNTFSSELTTSGGALTQAAHIIVLGTANAIISNYFHVTRDSSTVAGAVTTSIWAGTTATKGTRVEKNTFIESNGATFSAGVDYQMGVSGSVVTIENNFLLATAANAVINAGNSAGFGNNIANGTV